MPCKYAIAAHGLLVVERWTGTVAHEELLAHKAQQFRDPSIKAGASVLSDCTDAVFSISLEAIGKLSEMENNPEFQPKIRRYAFLVNNDVYARAQQFADRVNKYGKSVIIFNSLDVACLWLGIDALKLRDLMASIEGRNTPPANAG
jgi:hypothetical protein